MEGTINRTMGKQQYLANWNDCFCKSNVVAEKFGKLEVPMQQTEIWLDAVFCRNNYIDTLWLLFRVRTFTLF